MKFKISCIKYNFTNYPKTSLYQDPAILNLNLLQQVTKSLGLVMGRRWVGIITRIKANLKSAYLGPYYLHSVRWSVHLKLSLRMYHDAKSLSLGYIRLAASRARQTYPNDPEPRPKPKGRGMGPC